MRQAPRYRRARCKHGLHDCSRRRIGVNKCRILGVCVAQSAIIIGIDPGLRRCGWGVVAQTGAKLTHIAHGVIAPDPDAKFSDRLLTLFDGVRAIIAEYSPNGAAVEDAFVHKSAASALKLGHARASALLAFAEAGVPTQSLAPRTVKQSVCGTGGAEKSQVAMMVNVLLPGCGAKADAADALAVAIAGAHGAGGRIGSKIAV